ncbi:putative mediator of RNA polymerase II transcription subunit 26 isoform X3 [Eupeodes corollae]|uniref:putative mediator of RNA polymerase II transcription subunit 26 isoform X3 n=1 Tax=Eupeodes corollae TaxID=290404 RepID=UPI002493C09D|nr:putative mediator of RNA polymerase II transcription subunit 26 isoform X3 [Eupeodes corollae]
MFCVLNTKVSQAEQLSTMIEFKRHPFKMKINSATTEKIGRSCLRARLVFSWKTWAELADVLRKRRNRPDASDEDLGLPRSPTTPQRRETNNTTNQSEVSSLSMLSMNSTIDFDDELPSSTANHSGDFSSAADRTSSSISSKFSADSSRSEHVELFSSNWTRLSHSAAKHKMAVRPVKKKGPTRHRRTLESSILPSTPEVNEDQSKTTTATLEVKDISLDKAKSRSLPPGVNAKILEQHSTEVKQAVSIKRSKTEKGPSPNSTYAMRSNATKSSIFESVSSSTQSSTAESSKEDESGFFRRFVYRNSKRGASKTITSSTSNSKMADELDSQPESKKPNPPPIETNSKTIETKSAEYSQKVEETRKEIRRDILSTGNSALSAMLNTFILSPESEKMVAHATNENITISQPGSKPKSGPAARQRYIPKDLQQPQMMMDVDVNLKHSRTSLDSSEKAESHMREEFISKTIALSKISKSHTEESFQSTTLVREINAMRDQQKEHFEKKPKMLGMSAFQQKMSRSNDSFNMSSSTDSVEMLLGSDLRKRGKSVEKSKSFRTYIESKEDKEIPSLRNQVPSLPDLSQKSDNDLEDEKHLSLGFEINDNNLVKQKSSDLPLTHGIYTKNIILTTSKNMPSRIQTKSPLLGTSACSTNISEIEQNIDMLVKSPFVSVLRKSATISDSVASKLAPNVTISPMPNKRVDVIAKVENKIDRILRTEDKDLFIPPATPAAPPPTPATPPPILVAPTIVHSPTKVQMREKPKIVADSENRKSLRERNSSPQTTASSKSNSFHRSRRSSSVIESSSPSTKGVPEFMKIQLNRVDPVRPKSNVVLSKNARESTEDLTRRFSNESVEISEVKPPTPTDEDSPQIIPMVRSNSSTSSRSDESLPKSPTKKTPDEENNITRIDTNTPINNNIPLHERRRLFLSEDKLKNDRKIEEMKLERKKSMSEEVRKMPTEEEPVVVILRKKSFGVIQPSANNNKDDPTPELMKVFARRSLKIKDEDLPDPPIKKFVPSVDSDKENQSSSEEKLDKLSAIQQQQNGLPKSDSDISKNRNSLADFRNIKSQSLNNNGMGTPTKTFLPPIRLSGPFRQASQGSPVMGKSIDSTTNNNNNNSLTNNNNNMSVAKPIERQSLGTVLLSSSVPPSVTSTVEQNNFSTTTTTFTRATIERSATMATMNRVESEFKGIHQRRAEWEKRAKEALK